MSISSRIFRNMRSIELSGVVIRPGIICSSLATAADVKRIARCSGGSMINLGGGRPNQLSPHPQAYNLTQRKIQALSMAEWSLFRSEINQMRSSLTAIERTSGSIVMAAVETTCASTSIRPVKVRRRRASSFATDHRALTDVNPSRMPARQKSDIPCPNRLEPYETPNVSDPAGTESARVVGISSGAADCQTGIL